MPITKTTISAAKPGDLLRDDTVIGLELYIGERVSTWRVYYRVKETRQQRRLKLGYYPTLSLTDARNEARKALGQVSDGGDPAAPEVKKLTPDDVTLQYIYDKYIEVYTGKLKPKTIAGYKNMWKNHIQPALGDMGLKAIKKADVFELHHKVGKYQANRVAALISRLYKFAFTSGLGNLDVELKPTSGIDRNVEKARQRVASTEEFSAIGKTLAKWKLARESNKRQFARGIEAILLTGGRSSEWFKARKEWLVLDRMSLEIPDTKSNEPKAKAIPPALLQTLKDACNESKGECVFDTEDGSQLSYAWLWRLFKMDAGLGDLRLHDLRRSYATYGFSGGVSMEFISKLLGHSDTQVTENAYAYLIPEERRAAAEKVSNVLMEKLSGGLR